MNKRRNVVKTLFSNILGIQKQFGNPYVPILNSTLNGLYNIPSPVSDDEYKIGHFIIGLHPYDINNGGYVDLGVKEHQVYDGNVFTKIPIFMKETVETLTTLEKATYKLFTVETYNNINYNVAYAKRLNNVNSIGTNGWVSYNDTDGYSIFSLDSKNLDYMNPVLTDETITYPNKLDYISYSLEINAILTDVEIAKINSYIDIIYPTRTGSSKYTISEVGFLQSQHVSLNSSVELINAQVAYYTYLSMKDMVNSSIDLSIEVGELLPIQIS